MSMIGKSLVHYEITSEIGRGGMGEVYQAKDTKLGRDVAIKVLPEEFAMDHDRVARFQREAKLLASLNHPNIASIHGLEESDGTHFLVMELIEGDTLADRIKNEPIPVEEALQLAQQMAEALEAAHEKGVIHRDLKPANIKVTPDSKVKILDFGLAKAYAGDQANVSLEDSPTISAVATQQGVILGTAAYMSPEQARGKPVDRRADIWAFGCVLYEMLTGKKAFSGGDVTDTLAAVLRSEPEWESLPTNLHWRVKEVLERCLEKKAKDRYGSINDARVDIHKVLSDPSGIFAQPGETGEATRRQRPILLWVAVTAILCLIIAGIAIWYLKPAPPPEPKRVMRFTYELPEGQRLTENISLAVSPDGSQFVYSTTDGLYLRPVDALDARPVTGTDQTSRGPVFSPDCRWIAYWSSNDRKLKKIAVSGGVSVVLCDTGPLLAGLSWSSDNTIVYSDVMNGGVKRVSADGGTPELIIEADLAKLGTDGVPVLPRILPDGKTLLFTKAFSVRNAADRQIAILSLESGERKVLGGGSNAIYLSSGHLVYLQVNDNITSVVAVPFDPNTMEVLGGPVPLLECINAMALSDSGTLVYVPEAAVSSVPKRTLMWVDREGNETPINAPPNLYGLPHISPDGTKVALAATIEENRDIWIWDLVRENLMRLTFDEAIDAQPLWSPDGKRIFFLSFRDGMAGIYSKAANGTGEVTKHCFVPDHHLFPWSWSADGKTMVITEMSIDATKIDIGTLSMEDNGERKLILKEEYLEGHPQISPDGRWMAYWSTETGQYGIFVRPFPEVNQGKWQVSTVPGESPRWSPDGREIFYISQTGDAVMAVSVETEPTFSAGKPRELFRGTFVAGYQESPPYDIHPDGKRFLMIKPSQLQGGESAEKRPRKINIVLNWDEELKQRVPKE
jgi:serine/threonine protein kinase/Tol biopolymer transport system component